ncbi:MULTISPECIES: MarR family winged helix-turn-helix transcriptional regulator [Streptomyces]|uniref:MarR family winged helix-turn-helix transcriptional regulator n=1 Tax=Streptomyces TaxID=1883 RepID=UPI000A200172|nr:MULTISPECIES: MarR family transcriptional regulator [Streptomyces]MYR00821.1 MarR family transcriptional regulator [Streptomyces sp. SID6139]MYR20850.1 MarR family transcriptional regulator [Streptomyces sp. SID6137]WDO04616.1 MarR family transcriptional regulator [Streptomyces murinus]
MSTPDDPALDEPHNTVDALVQLSFLIQGELARVAADHDLSLIQVRLLGILRDRRPGMLELARHLDLDKSSMTGLVTRAEKRGLVKRERSPHDGRGILVALAPAGRALVDHCAGEAERRVAVLAESLTAREGDQLRDLAVKMLAARRERGRDVPPG